MFLLGRFACAIDWHCTVYNVYDQTWFVRIKTYKHIKQTQTTTNILLLKLKSKKFSVHSREWGSLSLVIKWHTLKRQLKAYTQWWLQLNIAMEIISSYLCRAVYMDSHIGTDHFSSHVLGLLVILKMLYLYLLVRIVYCNILTNMKQWNILP